LELGLGLDFYVEAQSFDSEFSSLPLLLSRLPKPILTSIKFEIWVMKNPTHSQAGGPHMAKATNTITIWDAIDQLLFGPSFTTLTKVAFNVSADTDAFEMIEYLECRMARCKQKGLLHISISEW
jgi:hypothetical protein